MLEPNFWRSLTRFHNIDLGGRYFSGNFRQLRTLIFVKGTNYFNFTLFFDPLPRDSIFKPNFWRSLTRFHNIDLGARGLMFLT